MGRKHLKGKMGQLFFGFKLMRAVSRDGTKRRSSGDGAGITPTETDVKEEVEARTLFSSGCRREN